MTLKKQIEEILKTIPETRNSDITLMIAVWKTYYQQRIHFVQDLGVVIKVPDLYDLPREDNIKRVRAAFNAEGKYWPTDLKVALGRGILEDKWREKLGYPVKAETKNPTKIESYTERVGKVTCGCGRFMEPTLSPGIYQCSQKKCNTVKAVPIKIGK